MPRITVDPATGRLMLDGQLLDRQDPRMWGSAGQYLEDAQSNIRREGGYDPRYYTTTQVQTGDSGYEDRYVLRPEIQARLAGRGLVQLNQSGVGGGGDDGYNEVIDPSKIQWDDELGMLTSPDNIRGQDPTVRRQNMLRAAAIMAPFAGAAVAHSAATGGFGAAGATPTGATPAGGYMGDPYSLDPGFFDAAGNAVGQPGLSTVAEGGANAGLDAFEGSLDGGLSGTPEGSGYFDSTFANGGLDPETLAGQGGMGSSRTEQLLNWVRANPVQAARMGITAASLVSGGADGGGSGGQYIDPTSPLRSTGNTPTRAATTTNPNAPVNTGAGSQYAPVNTAGYSTAVANPGGVTNYAGQTQGGAKVAIDPAIQSMLDFSTSRLNRYRDTFIPLEDLIVDEATRAGSEAMQNERAGLAADDVATQFRAARGTRQRNLQRGGGGGAFTMRGQSLMSDLDVGEGGATALAMNEARRGERDSGFGKRLAAAGIGDKTVSQGLSSLSGGVQAMLDQDRTAAGREASANSLSGTLAGISSREREGAADRSARRYEYDNTFGEGRRRYDLDRGDTNNRFDLTRGDRRYEFDTSTDLSRDRYASDDEYRRANLNMTGGRYADESRRGTYRDIGNLLYGGSQFLDSPAGRSLAGIFGFADGGEVQPYDEGGNVAGPGDETSDSIPAYLSDGEFVLPAEAVKILDQLDPGLLDRIQKLGLAVRKMGDDLEQGETLEGDYTVEA